MRVGAVRRDLIARERAASAWVRSSTRTPVGSWLLTTLPARCRLYSRCTNFTASTPPFRRFGQVTEASFIKRVKSGAMRLRAL